MEMEDLSWDELSWCSGIEYFAPNLLTEGLGFWKGGGEGRGSRHTGAAGYFLRRRKSREERGGGNQLLMKKGTERDR